jgi:DNA-damage-inducible protein J
MQDSTATLEILIDRDLKAAAEQVFHELGLDSDTAVRMFFTKVARTRSIPFKLKAGPEFSPEAEARILAAWEESKDPANLVGPFSDVKELFAHLRANFTED